MNNSMDKIEHIVYLMLENRSLDNVLGWLYTQGNPNMVLPPGSSPVYNGLQTGNYYNLDSEGNSYPVVEGSGNCYYVPDRDPNEGYVDVNNQLFQTGSTFPNNPPNNTLPTMGGFYEDYAENSDYPEQIMQSYTPNMLPVINGLAGQFAVSDAYFSSIPTQTNCNRAFAATGNSIGLNSSNQNEAWVNNHFASSYSEQLAVTFNQRTIFNALGFEGSTEFSASWMVYYNNIWDSKYCFTRDLLTQIQDPVFDNNFADINSFFSQAAAGTLPKFSFLEPAWGLMHSPDVGLQNGNDYHPPCNLKAGEYFLNQVYNALTSNQAAWEKTLFIINFDEHGGTYDHVGPAWGATAPWADPADGTPEPSAYEYDFQYNRFGVRVPMILVSPYIPQGLVFRAEEGYFDHTSVMATILKLCGIPNDEWKLGSRTKNAPTFEWALCLDQPRTDIPQFTPPLYASAVAPDSVPNDLQVGIAHRVIKYAAKKKGYDNKPEVLQSLYEQYFTDDKIATVYQMSASLKKILDSL